MTHTADQSAGLPNNALYQAIQFVGMAPEQFEWAQGGAGRRLEDALVEAEDTVDEQQAMTANTRGADEDEADVTGAAVRRRSARLPAYRAA
jgi:hypothetical protein